MSQSPLLIHLILKRLFLAASLVVAISAFLITKSVNAQVLSCGSYTCCTSGSTQYFPAGCNPLGCGPIDPSCFECTSSSFVCSGTTVYPCGVDYTPGNPYYGACRVGSTACIGGTGSGCSGPVPPPPGPTGPAPTSPPGSTPPPSTCTSGVPTYGISQCSDQDKDNGSGSCGAGCLCCKDKYVAACSWNPSSPSPCTPDGVWNGYGTPSYAPCCDGLTGGTTGVCSCPGICSIGLSHSSITLNIGETLDLTAYITNIKGSSVSRVAFSRVGNVNNFTRNPATDTSAPYQTTLTATAVGESRVRATASSTDGTTTCYTQTSVIVSTPAPAPPPPTIIAPTAGELVVPYDSNNGVPTKAIDITFTTQPDPAYNANRTYIEIYPKYPLGVGCASAVAKCEYMAIAENAPPGTTLTYRYHIPVTRYGEASDYIVRMRHECTTCSPQSGAFTPDREFRIGDVVSGKVLMYDGVAGLSGGKCTSPLPQTPITLSGGEQVTVTRSGNNFTTNINPDGTYSVIVPVTTFGTNSASYNSGTGSTVCGCPTGCSYPSINTPVSDLNFYYLEDRDPWWQAIGGHLLALRSSGTSISTQIPETCSSVLGCQRYLSLQDTLGTQYSSGTVVTGGGNIDTKNDAGGQTDNIDQDTRNIQARGITLSGVTENYAFFYRQFSMGVNPTEDIGAGANAIPNPPPSNRRAYYRNGNLTISTPTTIAAGLKKTIFVNGNLTITNTINVMDGGFLAFIVKGNITIDKNVCQSDPTSTDGVVEGVYVADGTITIDGDGNGDCKFVGEGVFAGWGGVTLARDYRDGGAADGLNSTNPVELFKYRPDFMVNLPEEMTRPLYLWQEVKP